MHDLILAKATETAAALSHAEGFAAPGDHPLIDMLVELFKKLLPLLTCFASPAKAHAEFQSPGLATRLVLRRKAIRQFGRGDDTDAVVDATLATLGKSTVAEFGQAMKV